MNENWVEEQLEKERLVRSQLPPDLVEAVAGPTVRELFEEVDSKAEDSAALLPLTKEERQAIFAACRNSLDSLPSYHSGFIQVPVSKVVPTKRSASV
jgi:hypothetical protein